MILSYGDSLGQANERFFKWFGHMTKMVATPIYGKKNIKNLLLQNMKADDLGTWYVALGMLGLPGLFHRNITILKWEIDNFKIKVVTFFINLGRNNIIRN